MSALRILHVVPYYEQAWAYGGIPRLATTMTRALARRGHRVTVCTTDARDHVSRATSVPRDDGVDVHVFPNLSNQLAYQWQFFTPIGLGPYLRTRAASWDIAHIHACHNLPGATAARVLSHHNVPYIVSPNGTAKPIERRIIAKRVFGATVGRHVLSQAARVLAVTQAERAQLLALGVAESAIRLVPNPLDDGEYAEPPDPQTFRRAHGLGDAPVVLFLGKLTPRKGVDVLVRALAQLPRADALLVVAGNDMGTGGAIDALTRDLRLTRRVVRTGLLRGRDRLDALAAADVMVYPSRDEIFGLAPLEALLCGTPVVVCDDSGCGEVIQAIDGGLLVPFGNVPALAAAIHSVLEAPAMWSTRVRAATGQARSRFGAETVCDQLEQVYDEVLRSRASAARTLA